MPAIVLPVMTTSSLSVGDLMPGITGLYLLQGPGDKHDVFVLKDRTLYRLLRNGSVRKINHHNKKEFDASWIRHSVVLPTGRGDDRCRAPLPTTAHRPQTVWAEDMTRCDLLVALGYTDPIHATYFDRPIAALCDRYKTCTADDLLPGIQDIITLSDGRIFFVRNDRFYRFYSYKNVRAIEKSSIGHDDWKTMIAHRLTEGPARCRATLPTTPTRVQRRRADMTYCDLIIALRLVRSAEDIFDMKELCRDYREECARQRLAQTARSTYRRHRHQYEFTEIPYPFKRMIPKMTAADMDNLCKHSLNTEYIKNMMKNPSLTLLIAYRRIPSSFPAECPPPKCYRSRTMAACGIPRSADIYRSAKIPLPFDQFKEMLRRDYPDPVERARYLCGLPKTARIGGFAILEEGPRAITVYILCSNRSIGKNILDELRRRGKRVFIDHPLDDVVEFYKKCGFQSISSTLMVG